jgi:uncharacterized protein YukE
MTDYTVTPDHMRETASGCSTTANNMNSELQAMVAFCRGIQWQGPAREGAWDPLVNRFQIAATDLNEALVNIATELNVNADNYDLGEGSATKNLIAVGDSVPTVNL